MKKKTVLILLQLILIPFLVSSISVKGLDVAWEIGDISSYELSQHVYIEQIDIPSGATSIIDSTSTIDFQLNITDIDNSTKTIDYDLIELSSTSSNSDPYGMSVYLSSFDELTDAIGYSVAWDFVNNHTVTTGLNFMLPISFFLEPNWSIANDQMKDILNTSTLIETFADPYEPKTYNFTFGDILADVHSYTINGVENDLVGSKAAMTASNSGWSLVFIFSNRIYTDYYNGTHDLYIPFERYILSFEIVYTSEGLLDHYESKTDFTLEYGELKTTQRTTTYYWLNGKPTTEESSLSYLLIIPAISIVVFTTKVVQRRKK